MDCMSRGRARSRQRMKISKHPKDTKGQKGRFLSGVSYLTISALLVKVIGFLYRIPMLTYLGTEGMGYFNTAYELYALFCVISTAGLPVAMSVLISSCEAGGQQRQVKRIFRVSFWAFLIIGLLGSLVLFGFAEGLSALLKNKGAAAGMRMISPTVLLICLSSAYRGYFQGKRQMAPTAISQVIEALGKLVLGVLFAAYAHQRGYDLPVVAAYAVLGLTVGTGVSVIYLWVQKWVYDARHPPYPDVLPSIQEQEACPAAYTHLLRRLLSIAVPVTLGAGVMGVTKLVDVALIFRRLQSAGFASVEAASLYGCYSTLAVPLFNMLPSLTTSVSLSAVPSLSSALGSGERGRDEAKQTVLSALRMTLWVAIPGALGLSVFAKDILSLLFGHQPEAVVQATPWLSCLALAIPASCLITVTGGLLQAAGRSERPVISMLVGIIVKSVLAYFLMGDPRIAMMGAPISTVACDVTIVLCNLFFLYKATPWLLPTPKQSLSLFVPPVLLSVLSVGSVVLIRQLGNWEAISSVATLMSVVTVGCIYGGGLLLWTAMKKPIKRMELKNTTET